MCYRECERYVTSAWADGISISHHFSSLFNVQWRIPNHFSSQDSLGSMKADAHHRSVEEIASDSHFHKSWLSMMMIIGWWWSSDDDDNRMVTEMYVNDISQPISGLPTIQVQWKPTLIKSFIGQVLLFSSSKKKLLRKVWILMIIMMRHLSWWVQDSLWQGSELLTKRLAEVVLPRRASQWHLHHNNSHQHRCSHHHHN